MSAYGKQPPPHLHGYDTSRPFSEGSFPYLQPSYGSQPPLSTTTAPHFPPIPQITSMAYAASPARATYDDQSGPYLNVGSTPTPEVTSYSPTKGSTGTKIFVYITSLYELITTNSPAFFLIFGQQKCPASITKASQQGGVCQYQITAEAPQFTATNWGSVHVPLFLFIETGDGDVTAKVDVGQYTYVDGELSDENSSSQGATRKRKVSSGSVDILRSPAKRLSGQQIRPKDEYSPFAYTPTEAGPYSPYMQQNNAYGNPIPQYNRPGPSYAGHPQSRHPAFSYPSSTASSSPTIKAPSPQVSSWSPSFPNLGMNLPHSPIVTPGGRPHRSSMPSAPSPIVAANPPLIRTSTLQQPTSPATTPHGAHAGQHFNAYSLYPHKAKLDLAGDLDAMARNWSEEEWDCKRRLVRFKRSQSGSTITASFQPVTIEDRPPSSICISCIYWEERNECFVTSVDTIFLLEQLVAARFTVEEKNRIRRNLEGFRPLTVSKGKSDSEDFFKVIMAFPNPKPRNIEKDVKVFHWKDLASALKKIISKYSASPSSTLPPAPAPPLLTPVSSTSFTTDSSSAGVASYLGADHRVALSPRSSTASTAYTASAPARVPSPKAMAGPPDLRVSVPHPHELSMRHMPAPYHPPGGRASWDPAGYLDSSPATAGATASVTYPPPPRTGGEHSHQMPRRLSTQQQQGSNHPIPRP